jgi:hypothetical protein
MGNKSDSGIIEHSFSCDECREITREMINADRAAFVENFRTVIKEEWQCSINTIDRVSRLENIQSWLIVVCLAQTLAIVYLFTRIL